MFSSMYLNATMGRTWRAGGELVVVLGWHGVVRGGAREGCLDVLTSFKSLVNTFVPWLGKVYPSS